MIHTVSSRMFEEQKNVVKCALLLNQATMGAAFEEAVMSVLERHLGVDHFSVFANSPNKPARLLAAGSRKRDGVSMSIAQTYAARYYRSDPVPPCGIGAKTAERLLVRSRRAADVRNPRYRRECYENHGIAERLTIGSSEFGTWRLLHLYRQRNRPSFDDVDVAQALRAAACILTALPFSGAAIGQPRDARWRLPWFVARLRELSNLLSGREIEVCARALLGMTVEGTALDLGIASTSVATYRKRAYQKLHITSQNELYALLR